MRTPMRTLFHPHPSRATKDNLTRCSQAGLVELSVLRLTQQTPPTKRPWSPVSMTSPRGGRKPATAAFQSLIYATNLTAWGHLTVTGTQTVQSCRQPDN